jgi:hypothetical protein
MIVMPYRFKLNALIVTTVLMGFALPARAAVLRYEFVTRSGGGAYDPDGSGSAAPITFTDTAVVTYTATADASLANFAASTADNPNAQVRWLGVNSIGITITGGTLASPLNLLASGILTVPNLGTGTRQVQLSVVSGFTSLQGLSFIGFGYTNSDGVNNPDFPSASLSSPEFATLFSGIAQGGSLFVDLATPVVITSSSQISSVGIVLPLIGGATLSLSSHLDLAPPDSQFAISIPPAVATNDSARTALMVAFACGALGLGKNRRRKTYARPG